MAFRVYCVFDLGSDGELDELVENAREACDAVAFNDEDKYFTFGNQEDALSFATIVQETPGLRFTHLVPDKTPQAPTGGQ